MQFVKSGLEIERSSLFDRAAEAVARCSNADKSKVVTNKLGRTDKTVGQIVEIAIKLNKEYSFLSYNCRHFVLDLLKQILK